MNNYIESKNKIAFHPGYYIKEIIDNDEIDSKEFANQLGISHESLEQLMNGEQSITEEIAMKLSRLLGTSADYWANLQKEYDRLKAELE